MTKARWHLAGLLTLSAHLLLIHAAPVSAWEGFGARVCVQEGQQVQEDAIADGFGGLIVVWRDTRDEGYSGGDIYAQRVDSLGHALWQLGGVPVCTAVRIQRMPVITSDGLGGGIIAWADYRRDSGILPTLGDIYVQRLDATGVALWTPQGVRIDTTSAAFPAGIGDIVE